MGWDRDDSFIKGYKGDEANGWPIGAKITSETDGSIERLHVKANISGGNSDDRPVIDKRLIYLDMNATNGGVARGTNIQTSFVKLFEYLGSGYLLGFFLMLESMSTNWFIKMENDGASIFMGSTGILTNDLWDSAIYDYKVVGADSMTPHLGFSITETNGLRWESPHGSFMKFDSSIKIYARKSTSNGNFRAGLVSILET